MEKLKAVYAHGKVVTGITHGEAFSNLSEAEKQGNDFVIGRWCAKTGRFEGDDGFFFTKKILLIRHGTPACGYEVNSDPCLSGTGRSEVCAVARHLRNTGWSGTAIYHSPKLRCVETSGIIERFLGVKSEQDEELREFSKAETYVEYRNRVEKVIERLPEKSILISHCTFIQDVAQYVGSKNSLSGVSPASMTLIDHNEVVYLGKGIPKDETIRRS